MGRLISILIIVLDVVVILDILKSSKDMEPILGPVLYYFIGRK